MNSLLIFLGGMFFFNAIPHLIKGISGQTHMTPIKRISSPEINVIWAFLNILLGLIFLGLIGKTSLLIWPWQLNFSPNDSLVFLFGGLLMSLMDAHLFKDPSAHLPWQTD